jgi:hypothetical protein
MEALCTRLKKFHKHLQNLTVVNIIVVLPFKYFGMSATRHVVAEFQLGFSNGLWKMVDGDSQMKGIS